MPAIFSSKSITFIFAVCLTILYGALPPVVFSQIESPDRNYLFNADRDKDEEERRRKNELRQRKKMAEARQATGQELPFDINAKSISFDSTANKLIAEGNVIITYSALVAEAMRGEVDVVTNEATLSGDVRITDITSDITADEAKISLETGEGGLRNCNILFTEGDYRLSAAEANRSEGDVYNLKDALFTTCDCPVGGGSSPWTISAREAEITRNGYGYAWHATLRVKDIPVLYVPFMVFPAKNERQTGLLPPTFGSGRQSGFDYSQPFFWAIDRSTDATLTGVYESNIRLGADLEFRKIFSRAHSMQAGFIYFDESARDGDLFGTDITGLNDPIIDENRIAGYWDQSWQTELGSVPLSFVIDGAYASDDLFIREYPKDEIAEFNSRFITSRALLRAPLPGTFSADLSAEYNQAIVDDDDFVFQRLPELVVSGINTFRPFGENPFGLKLVATTTGSYVNFVRRESFEGMRGEVNERLTVPFHFRNYLDGSIEGTTIGSLYGVSSQDQVDSDGEPVEVLDSSSSRLVPGLTGRLNTVVERVYDLDDGNWLKVLGELGRIGRSSELNRIKHTVEPGLKYQFVPVVNQLDNPQFDSNDRLAERNLVTYSLTQRLLGRYEPRDEYLYGIEEVTPEPSDLGNLRSRRALDQELSFGFEAPVDPSEFRALRRGSVVELARLTLSQSLDVNRERSSTGESLSDAAVDLLLFPNDHVKLRARSDFDVEEKDFRSYSVDGQLTSKRGDSIRSRLRFVESSVRQLESSVELKVTDFLRLGYYSRYDDLRGEFIEQRGGVRFLSECKCWVLDVQVSDRSNPDETKFSFNVTLVGLGELGNTFFSRLNDGENS